MIGVRLDTQKPDKTPADENATVLKLLVAREAFAKDGYVCNPNRFMGSLREAWKLVPVWHTRLYERSVVALEHDARPL